jgi:hypothetical protein
MIHYSPLQHLPDGITIPERYRDRFWYDEERRALIYQGPMYKATFDRLSTLSLDFDYQRSLEELFRLAVPEEPAKPSRFKAIAVAAGVLFAVAAAFGGLLIWHGG